VNMCELLRRVSVAEATPDTISVAEGEESFV
jgi:hypothetical protein